MPASEAEHSCVLKSALAQCRTERRRSRSPTYIKTTPVQSSQSQHVSSSPLDRRRPSHVPRRLECTTNGKAAAFHAFNKTGQNLVETPAACSKVCTFWCEGGMSTRHVKRFPFRLSTLVATPTVVPAAAPPAVSCARLSGL